MAIFIISDTAKGLLCKLTSNFIQQVLIKNLLCVGTRSLPSGHHGLFGETEMQTGSYTLMVSTGQGGGV